MGQRGIGRPGGTRNKYPIIPLTKDCLVSTPVPRDRPEQFFEDALKRAFLKACDEWWSELMEHPDEGAVPMSGESLLQKLLSYKLKPSTQANHQKIP